MALTLLCLLATTGFSQNKTGTLDLSLVLKDTKGNPMPETPIEFLEMNTRKRIALVTNEAGEAHHVFQGGHFWQLNVLDIKDYFYWQFEVRPGRNRTVSRTVTYHPKHIERVTRPPVDRTTMSLKRVDTRDNRGTQADAENGIVHLKISRPNGNALSNYAVELTAYSLGKTFAGKTNAAGDAYFKVPLGQEYEIDIDGIESFQYVDLPKRERYTANKRFRYEPTLVIEKEVNDTITQDIAEHQKGTSDRVMARITLKGGPNGVWQNEPVYLKDLKGPQCYTATTNSQGQVAFLLPKGKQFMIHARFEKNLDVLDYRRKQGIGYNNKSVLYRPLAKYQFPGQFIPKPEDIVTQSFRNFLDKQYPRPEQGEALRSIAEFTGLLHPEAKEAVLRLAFTSTKEGNIDYAPPLNLSFVIDESGSMAGEERIDQLKLSLEAFLKKLRPSDRVSLVSFNDYEEVLMPGQKLDLGHGLDLIQKIEAGGGTNIYKGLVAGYKEVARAYRRGSCNRVILLSDGYGVTPPEEIFEAQKPFTEKGIECSTVGVGEDYNYALLKLLATKGGGHIEHVGEAKGLQAAFMNQLASVLFPVARNVKFEVAFPQGLEYKQLYGHPVKSKSGNRLQVELKNFYAGMDEIAFLRFLVPQPTKELCEKPVRIRLTYTDVLTGKVEVKESEVFLEWQEFTGEPELVHEQNEKKMYAMAVLNQSLKVMADRFHCNKLPAAKAAIEDGMEQLRRVYPSVKDEDLLALKHSLEDYLDIISKQLDTM